MMTHTPRRTPTADGRRRFSILLTASLVSSLIMLDPNIVAVSLPSIARSLGATFVDFALFKQPTFLGAACATLGYAVKGFKGAGISQARHHLMNVFLGLRTFLARNEEVFLASCFLDFLTQRQAVRTRAQAGGGAQHAWHLARRGIPMGRVDDA
jgi:hypothetical protein